MVALFAFAFGRGDVLWRARECEAWRGNVVVVVVFLFWRNCIHFCFILFDIFLFVVILVSNIFLLVATLIFPRLSFSSSSSSSSFRVLPPHPRLILVDSSSSGFKNPASSAPRSPLIFLLPFHKRTQR